MRKIALIAAGLALMASAAGASAQEHKSTGARGGYIGIRFNETRTISSDAAASAKIVVMDVSKGSPAEKAGLKSGDEILRINGLNAGNGKFAAVARTLTAGDTVKLRVKRDGKDRDFTLVAAPRPDNYASVVGDRTVIFSADSVRGLMRMYLDSARVHLDSLKLPRIWVQGGDSTFDIRIRRHGDVGIDTLFFGKGNDSLVVRRFREGVHVVPSEDILRHFEGELGPGQIFRSIELGSRSIAGAEFTDLDPAMKTYFGTDRGLLTLRVVPETPAAKAGLAAGDIVVKANDRAVTRVADLRTIMMARPQTLKLEIIRKGETRTLEIQNQRKGSDD